MAGVTGAAGDPDGAVPPLEAADRHAGRVGPDAADAGGPDTGTTLAPEDWPAAAGDVSGGVDSGAGAASLARLSRPTSPASPL
jgi:hypothetical protein